jgi:hypothetical protein
MKCMSIYTAVQRADRAGFDVSVTGDEAVRHTMLGFKTEADAEVRIEQDRQRGLLSVVTDE